MTLTRRAFGLTSLAALATPALGQSQTQTFRMACWLPARHIVPYEILTPWFEVISDVTQGRVVMELEDNPYGGPANQFEAVRSGAVDMGFCQHGFDDQAKFKRAQIGQFSFLGDSYGTSVVFSDIYRQMLAADTEHDGVKLMGLFTHGPGALFLKNRNFRNIEELQGLKIRTPGGYISTLLNGMGAETPVLPDAQVAGALARDEIDGGTFAMHAVPGFGFADRETNATTFPGGLFNSTWYIAMNPDSWNRISARDQRSIAQLSAEVVGPLAGKAFDEADYRAIQGCLRLGMTIDRASDELVADVASHTARHELDWATQVTAQGFDGTEALASLRRMTGQVRL